MIEVSYKTIDSKEELQNLEKFCDDNWDESIHEGLTSDQFFDTSKYLIYAKIDGNKVGQIYIFPRHVIFKNVPMYFAGVGGVVTHKQYRHQDIGTKMLFFAKDFLMKNKFDFAMLCTDIPRLGSFYSQVGFEPTSKPYEWIDKKGNVGLETGGMIQSLNSPEKVNLIQTSGENFNVGISNF